FAIVEYIIIVIQRQVLVTEDKKKSKTEKKEEESNDEVVFSLTLEGEYNEILDYIFKLENLNYVLNISSIDIKTRSVVPTLRNQVENKEEPQKSLKAEVIISFIPQK
ncbi:MAG: hypothetical protein PF549_01910, partial [Patescibacteria group bacterium]|nr:hypothetical protein [Patescibacteria group bacterium]